MLVDAVQVVGGVLLPILLMIIILVQRAEIRRLKRALLAWREDTLRAGKKLQGSGRQFPEISSQLQYTLNYIDDALRGR